MDMAILLGGLLQVVVVAHEVAPAPGGVKALWSSRWVGEQASDMLGAWTRPPSSSSFDALHASKRDLAIATHVLWGASPPPMTTPLLLPCCVVAPTQSMTVENADKPRWSQEAGRRLPRCPILLLGCCCCLLGLGGKERGGGELTKRGQTQAPAQQGNMPA